MVIAGRGIKPRQRPVNASFRVFAGFQGVWAGSGFFAGNYCANLFVAGCGNFFSGGFSADF